MKNISRRDKKLIIVTGANGFVGCNIVGALSAAGYRVSAVDRAFDNPAYGHMPAGNLRRIRADCVDLPLLEADALIHAAAVTARPAGARGESPEDNLRANIEPLLAVSEYAERQRIRAGYLHQFDRCLSDRRRSGNAARAVRRNRWASMERCQGAAGAYGGDAAPGIRPRCPGGALERHLRALRIRPLDPTPLERGGDDAAGGAEARARSM